MIRLDEEFEANMKSYFTICFTFCSKKMTDVLN